VESDFFRGGALRPTALCGVTSIQPCTGGAASYSQCSEHSYESVALVGAADYAVRYVGTFRSRH
jgi:hypothetical protein